LLNVRYYQDFSIISYNRCILGFFLDQNLGTDVKFIVGTGEHQEIVSAHKIILGSASPVFFSMFFSDLDSETEVLIPDWEPESFKALIHVRSTISFKTI